MKKLYTFIFFTFASMSLSTYTLSIKEYQDIIKQLDNPEKTKAGTEKALSLIEELQKHKNDILHSAAKRAYIFTALGFLKSNLEDSGPIIKLDPDEVFRNIKEAFETYETNLASIQTFLNHMLSTFFEVPEEPVVPREPKKPLGPALPSAPINKPLLIKELTEMRKPIEEHVALQQTQKAIVLEKIDETIKYINSPTANDSSIRKKFDLIKNLYKELNNSFSHIKIGRAKSNEIVLEAIAKFNLAYSKIN